MGARFSIAKAAAGERLRFDMGALRDPIARSVYAAGLVLIQSSSTRQRGYDLLMRLHTAALAPSVDAWIVDRLREATRQEKQGRPTGLWDCYRNHIRAAVSEFLRSPQANPARYIGTRLLVVKRSRPNERGVIVIDYSNIFPLAAGLFDLRAIAERYTLVIEPSWTGLCIPEVLLFTELSQTVFVQTVEPRDGDFIRSLGVNLSVVPIAANWWVDTRVAPPADAVRDIDVIMVASWADWKRHWRFFKAISQLRKRGHRLKVVLVGYAYGRTRSDIEALAVHFGIRDQVEIFERISQDEVWALLVRSKLHVLWSRREGSNRAIIEAMIADVPIIVRDGLSFGFKYPYINEHTGRFVAEHRLADEILDVLTHPDRHHPRQWVLRNMTSRKATETLEAHLRGAAEAAGEPWTEGLAVKTSALDGQRYLDESDRDRFAADYEFLESTLLGNPAAPAIG